MYLLFVLLLFVFIKFIHVIVHEFGHAIPMAAFTKQKVEVYIGSHGNKAVSTKVTTRKFDIYFKKNILEWRGGLCKTSVTDTPIKAQLIYIAAGPVAALVVGILICCVGFMLDAHDTHNKLNIYFLCICFALFLSSIIPSNRKILLAYGGYTQNDGYILRRLLRLKRYEQEHNEALRLYKLGNFSETGDLFAFLFKMKIDYNSIFNFTLNSYLLSKQYDKGLSFIKEAPTGYIPDADGYCLKGTLKIYGHLYTDALKDLKESLKLKENHIIALNNIGYCYIVLKEYKEAIRYLDKAIGLNADFAYALNNRGLAKIKTGKLNEGFVDIEKAMTLDPSAPYTNRNMGIYFMEIGGYAKALPYLVKAKELDSNTDMIDELLAEAKANTQTN